MSLVYVQFVFIAKVSGSDASPKKIVIEYNVTIKDHVLLANNTKHWVGAGMRSGYQMLWVGQEALYVYKVCIVSLCQTSNSPYLCPYVLYIVKSSRDEQNQLTFKFKHFALIN